MTIFHHGWVRYWAPDRQGYPIDDFGFPVNPTSQQFYWGKPRPFRFDELAELPCLVLLGDPGLGKTTALKEAFAVASLAVKEGENFALFKNLGEYEDQSFLVEDVFRNPVVEKWQDSERTLHLFLDSLDEGRLHIKTIANNLVSRFQHLPIDRLRLRIACRSAEWPESLTDALQSIFKLNTAKPDPPLIYHLVPLHGGDVSTAARALKINANAFLETVHQGGLVPLAMRPVTLRLLFDIFKQEGRLPSSKWDIYEKGCLHQCEDSQERKDGGGQSRLSAARKFEVAGHAFFHQLFSNRAFFWRGAAVAAEAEQGLAEEALLGDMPQPKGGSCMLAPDELREVFATSGLFTRQEENRLIPAHQTYAEFLACHHLLRFSPSTEQLHGLLFGADGHLVPQLQELAGWLIGKRDDVLDAVIASDPDVLLRGDIASRPADVKRKIVESILRDVDATRIDGRWRWLEFGKLNHPGLEEQLRHWLGRGFSTEARDVAMIIARQCVLVGLSEQLVQIALDPDDEYQARIMAALTISDIGASEAKKALRPLALGERGGDPRDELKGYAIKAAWPEHITAEELFGCLTPRRDANLIGSYYVALEKIPEQLFREHYPAALMWVARGLPKRSNTYCDIARKILTGACLHLRDDDVFDAFVVCVSLLQSRHDQAIEHEATTASIREILWESGRTREYVLGKCMECSEMPEKLISYQIARFWKAENHFVEAVALYESEPDEYVKPVLLVLASWLYSWDRVADTELVLHLIDHDEQFARRFSWLQVGCILDAAEMIEAKDGYYKWGEGSVRRKPTPVPDITEATFQEVLGRGDDARKAWLSLRRLLMFIPGQSARARLIDFDLHENKMWQMLSPGTQSQVWYVGLDYLVKAEPSERAWLHVNRYTEADQCGIDALNLLCAFSPHALDLVPVEQLKKWLPDIIGMPIWGGGDPHKLRTALVKFSMSRLPSETVEVVSQHLQLQAASSDGVLPQILNCFEGVWTSELISCVAMQIGAPESGSKYAMSLLRQLARSAPEAGNEIAARLFLAARSLGAEAIDIASAAASTLVSHSPKLDWPLIWAEIVADPDFSHAFMVDLVYGRQFDLRRLELISERSLAELYVHLFVQYPNRDDPEYGGLVSARHEISDFKRQILQHLTRRATLGAVEALETIHKHDPELDWVRRSVAEARENLRRSLWVAPTSQELNQLLWRSDRVLIQNEEQLVKMVVRQLSAIESGLQGHTPLAYLLWNENDPCSPKPENDFSNYVKSELEKGLIASGIILNREVEIHRAEKGIGERVDIHIDAVARRGTAEVLDRVKLIIEVKGCWNRELKTAMKEQLLERYMEESDCHYGIYLIGWFKCAKWGEESGKRKRKPVMTIEEAKCFFDVQATKLTSEKKKLFAYVMDARLT